MRLSFSLVFFLSAIACAGGEAVDPNTPSAPPPAPTPARPTAPPDCVKKILDAIYDREKTFFEAKKQYSESLLEIRALSTIGVGCYGWDLPEMKMTYGGSGYTATMTETASGDKWTINQDKTLVLDVKEVKPIFEPPAKK